MSYSRWGGRGSGHWYTYWCIQPEETENRDSAIFDICGVANFTAKQLREELGSCLENVSAVSPNGDIEELKIYVDEFLSDVDAMYGPI